MGAHGDGSSESVFSSLLCAGVRHLQCARHFAGCLQGLGERGLGPARSLRPLNARLALPISNDNEEKVTRGWQTMAHGPNAAFYLSGYIRFYRNPAMAIAYFLCMAALGLQQQDCVSVAEATQPTKPKR